MLVSIIVPMYNCEKYIGRCLDSILSQTYTQFEIILVDDGSKDQTVARVKSYRDKRIKLYTKQNEGVSITRNFGMQQAAGELIMFVDADDYIHSEMLSHMLELVIDPNDSFIICNNLELWRDRIEERILFPDEATQMTKDLIIHNIVIGRAGLVCCKLVSRKVIEEARIQFDANLRIGEDQLFFTQVALHINHFAYLNQALYYYDRTNEESATIKYQENLSQVFIYLQGKLEDLFKANDMYREDEKRILNHKVREWFWICLVNEVKNIKRLGVVKATQHIRKLVNEVHQIINLNSLESQGVVNKQIHRCIRKNNLLATIELMIISSIVIMKNS